MAMGDLGGGGGSGSSRDLPVASFSSGLSRAVLADPDRVPLRYRLADRTSPVLDVRVEFSLNGGQSFAAAAEIPEGNRLPGEESDGLSGLAASPAGEDHVFLWDARADLAGDARAVIVRIVPLERGAEGMAALSNAFIAGNTTVAVDVRAPAPLEAVSGDVTILFALADAEGDRADLAVEYEAAPGDFRPASAAVPDEAAADALVRDLLADGRLRVFPWDSRRDLGPVNRAVRLRLVATDSEPGAAALVDVEVRNNTPPFIAVDRPLGTSPSGAIPIGYRAIDADGDPCAIEVTFSEDFGRTFRPATIAARASADGTKDVPSSAQGEPSTFVWDSAADLGPVLASSVRLRVAIADRFMGAGDVPFAEEVVFDVDNRPVALGRPYATEVTRATRIHVADFDADGQADILFARTGTTAVSLARGVAASGTFEDPRVSANLSTIFGLGAVDLDGDGRPEPVAIRQSGGSDQATIFLARSAGIPTMAPANIGSLNGSVGSAGNHWVRGADIDADGKTDIAIVRVSGASSTIRADVFLDPAGSPRQEDVTYTRAEAFDAGAPAIAATADLDAIDPNDDVAVIDGSVLFGKTDFDTARRGVLALGQGTRTQVLAADLDRDGWADLIYAIEGATEARAAVAFGPLVPPATNGGTAVPAATAAFVTGLAGRPRIAQGDFDADGLADLAVAVSGATALEVRWFAQTAARSFVELPVATAIAGAGDCRGAEVADLDGDGLPELALLATGGLYVARAGSARAGRIATSGAGDLVAAAIGRSGTVGLVARAEPSDSQLVTFAPARGFRPEETRVALDPREAVLADASGDGFADLILHAGDGTIETAVQNVGHSLDAPYPAGGTGQQDGVPVALAAGDPTGDGREDVLVATRAPQDGGVAAAIAVQGPAGVLPSAAEPLAFAAEQLVVADLDGDGAEDVIGLASGPGPQVFFAPGPTAAAAGAAFAAAAIPEPATLTALALYRRGAGRALVASGPEAATTVVIEVTGGSAPVLTVDAGEVPAAFSAFATGDLNGDGIEDLVAGGAPASGIALYLGTAGGGLAFSRTLAGPGGAAARAVALAVGDVNGDGRDDIFAMGEGGAAATSVVYYQSGTGDPADLVGPVEIAFGAAPLRTALDTPPPVIADQDGDGWAEIAAFGAARAAQPVTATATIRQVAGGVLRVEADPDPLARTFVAGDLDGDAIADLAVTRPDAVAVRTRRANAAGVAGRLDAAGGALRAVAGPIAGAAVEVPPLALAPGDAGVVSVALAPCSTERVELRARVTGAGGAATGVRRLRLGKLALPPGFALAGPPILAVPETLPFDPAAGGGAAAAVLTLPCAPELRFDPLGSRTLSAFRLDRETGAVEAIAAAPLPGGGGASVAVPRLGTFALGIAGNALPVGSIAGVAATARDVTVSFSCADPDGDFVTPLFYFSRDAGATLVPCTPRGPAPGPGAPGAPRTFVWNAVADLGTMGAPASFVVVLVPRDVVLGRAVASAPFLLQTQ